MDYRETLTYLDELAASGIKLGLDSMRSFLLTLGSPQNSVPAIHVAGSNGKGSTAAFLSSILVEAGYHVGLYTSPHLVNVEERIAIDQRPVVPQDFAAAATQVRTRVEHAVAARELERPLTYFEFLTAMAFHTFQKQACDLQVVEAGLGGRLDATNTIDKPLLCIVTRIDLDHSAHLGSTLEAIAAEKAGIARAGVPVLTFERRPETVAVLRAAVQKAGGTLVDVAKEFHASVDAIGNVTVRVGRSTFHEMPVSLPGEHQVENLALALRAVEVLNARGFAISQDQVQMGVANTRWPGRLEVVRTNPTVLLDGAHNPAGARALAAYLDTLGPEGKLYLVFGAMKDKDIDGILEPILPHADKVFVTRADIDRAAEIVPLEAAARKHHADVTGVASAAEAVTRALSLATPDDTVLVTGSLLLVGDVKRHLEAA
jgi:dihydrofolate synthase / folylpolyglutamate synthase